MATTTNFGWETPDDTDLVKDGAAAMRTLGNSIDASFVDLKGGTTGQVLSKNSNTDLDFTWVAQDDSNAIQNSIVDAKADLITATANDTPARLAVGNNGETLVADSSTSTGLRWQSPKTVNYLLNGSMDIWQRGTSFTSLTNSVSYTADRWCQFVAAVVTQAEAARSTDAPTGFTYSLKYGRPNGETDHNQQFIAQVLESAQSRPLAGKTIALSFYAKKGANYSAASDALIVKLSSGTGTDQSAGTFSGGPATGFTGNTLVIDSSATLTTSWQRFTFTGSVASSATQIGLAIGFDPVGTAGADDNFYITGVQLEVGTVATPFQTATGTLAGEFLAAQRYFIRYNSDALTYGYIGNGSAASTTSARISVPFPVKMRVTPTVAGANLMVQDFNTITAVTAVAVVGNQTNSQNGFLDCTVASGLTQFRPYALQANNNTGAYLDYSSEL